MFVTPVRLYEISESSDTTLQTTPSISQIIVELSTASQAKKQQQKYA